MSSDLTRERRAEIEEAIGLLKTVLDANEDAAPVTLGMIAKLHDGLIDTLAAYDAMTRERDLLAETARRVTGERDRAEQACANAERERDAAVRAIEDAQCWLREPLTVKDARNARERLTAYENERLKRAARAKHDAARATEASHA